MGHSVPNHHEDHIAGKGNNSLQHYNLVHKFIPMPQAIKIPAAKAAVDKEWEKLEKVRSKKEVIDEARTTGAKVHFASLMDICHLKNAEYEAKHQKYKGRVVLRGDIVRRRLRVLRSIHRTRIISISNDSSKSHGYHLQIARLRMDKQQTQYQLIPRSKWKMLQILVKIPKSECPDIWIRLPRHKWPKSWSSMEDHSRSS